MTNIEALIYCLEQYKLGQHVIVYDKDGNEHWVINAYGAPRLKCGIDYSPFADSIGPYRKEKD